MYTDTDALMALNRIRDHMLNEDGSFMDSGDAERDLSAIARSLASVIPGSISCTNCGWVGVEDDLKRVKDAEDGEWSDACPKCLTDNFLMDTDLSAPRPTETRLREALETAAIRLAHLAGQIEAGFNISGTLRAEQAMKARHMSDEASAVLKEAGHVDG